MIWQATRGSVGRHLHRRMALVQGHAYDALNRRADRLATQAIDRPGNKVQAKVGGAEVAVLTRRQVIL